MKTILWLAICAMALSCGKADADAVQVAPVAVPVAPAVGDGAGPFVLRYFAPASGQLVQVKTAADVPEGARGQVLVTYDDPALQGPWLYVADLTQKQADHYTVRSVDRDELEEQLAGARARTPAAMAPPADPALPAAPGGQAGAAPPAPAAAKGDVVIYRTAWCGYCKKAAEYLKLKGVPFIERDLERDPGAREDMLARAKQAGVGADRLQGVPILSVRGKIINGFDRGAIDRALAGG